MQHGSLFSGIGGFDLAAEWMGWNNIFHCEWNPFGQTVLKYYWPDAKSYEDIKKTDFTIHRGSIDVLSGGFPCQPYSVAGKRLGKEDDRHLWPEMLRAIREISPSWVVGENVRGLTNWNGGLVFDEVQSDLEIEGFQIIPFLLPACAVNAPHRRDRIWFIAYSHCNANRNFRKQDRETNSVSGECWPAIHTGESIGTVAGYASDSDGLRRIQEHELQQTELLEQLGKKRIITNANGDRKKDYQPGSVQEFKGIVPSKMETGPQQFGGTGSISKGGTTTNPNGNIGCERGMHTAGSKEAERYTRSRYARGEWWNDWHEFPTQPPVCNGNDGISPELAGIAFSKWRNESIKAGGNAIVPQVAYNIFKAIQEYTNQNPIQ